MECTDKEILNTMDEKMTLPPFFVHHTQPDKEFCRTQRLTHRGGGVVTLAGFNERWLLVLYLALDLQPHSMPRLPVRP